MGPIGGLLILWLPQVEIWHTANTNLLNITTQNKLLGEMERDIL